jgi:histidinol-phosphate/aromatic aminotransferase/cobyric acid decarboxylase-like protein
VAQPEVVEQMLKVKDSYNVDAISVAAATAAIEDQEYARERWEFVKSERQRLSAELTQIGWTVAKSQANFILATSPDARGRRRTWASSGRASSSAGSTSLAWPIRSASPSARARRTTPCSPESWR